MTKFLSILDITFIHVPRFLCFLHGLDRGLIKKMMTHFVSRECCARAWKAFPDHLCTRVRTEKNLDDWYRLFGLAACAWVCLCQSSLSAQNNKIIILWVYRYLFFECLPQNYLNFVASFLNGQKNLQCASEQCFFRFCGFATLDDRQRSSHAANIRGRHKGQKSV